MPDLLSRAWSAAAEHWPVLVSSFVVTLAVTPACRLVARRFDLCDRPDGRLKPHRIPTPYLGGVAILAGWAVGIAPSLATGRDTLVTLALLVAGLAVTSLGLLDDIRPLSPGIKLGAIAVVALVPALAHRAGPLDLALAIGITAVACTATNLIDGMDGLCAGVVGISALGLAALALVGSDSGANARALVLSLALAGAAFGFLPFNLHRAGIFMGDAGSLLLGFGIASAMLSPARGGGGRGLLTALFAFGLPLLALAATVTQRLREGRPLMQGDRRHYYDQWSDRGWSARRVAGVSYALAGLFAAGGCVATLLPAPAALALCAVVTAAVGWTLHRAATAGT
ncbi:MAG: undecaprenyl/decaprenyl-phosphate alpha-N-acetylglucosaminyl 1-phosphate transferase [bacterium]|nr:undecaprenyl/decaprenyl-phosphate alpha-N-acetylglucosaminyl 1-phosphate transferase [bacterium]